MNAPLLEAAAGLDAIAVFVKVVQAGSFRGAARLLGMPNTTVSAKVARLEVRLGVTLIQRTTRKLHVTPAGQAPFTRRLRGLEEIETAEAEITSSAPEPRGVRSPRGRESRWTPCTRAR